MAGWEAGLVPAAGPGVHTWAPGSGRSVSMWFQVFNDRDDDDGRVIKQLICRGDYHPSIFFFFQKNQKTLFVKTEPSGDRMSQALVQALPTNVVRERPTGGCF